MCEKMTFLKINAVSTASCPQNLTAASWGRYRGAGAVELWGMGIEKVGHEAVGLRLVELGPIKLNTVLLKQPPCVSANCLVVLGPEYPVFVPYQGRVEEEARSRVRMSSVQPEAEGLLFTQGSKGTEEPRYFRLTKAYLVCK
jgi:hypothetical protein